MSNLIFMFIFYQSLELLSAWYYFGSSFFFINVSALTSPRRFLKIFPRDFSEQFSTLYKKNIFKGVVFFIIGEGGVRELYRKHILEEILLTFTNLYRRRFEDIFLKFINHNHILGRHRKEILFTLITYRRNLKHTKDV